MHNNTYFKDDMISDRKPVRDYGSGKERVKRGIAKLLSILQSNVVVSLKAIF